MNRITGYEEKLAGREGEGRMRFRENSSEYFALKPIPNRASTNSRVSACPNWEICSGAFRVSQEFK
jgi:hypothetical protein